jgi:hypothetical protein
MGTITVWSKDRTVPPMEIPNAQYKGNTNGMIEIHKQDGTTYWFNLDLIGYVEFVPVK